MTSNNKLENHTNQFVQKIRENLKDNSPPEVFDLLDKHPYVFERYIFEKWREERRIDDLIDYMKNSWTSMSVYSNDLEQVLLDIRLNGDEEKARELLSSLYFRAAGSFWTKVANSHRPEKSLPVAIDRGKVALVLKEWVFLVNNVKPEDRNIPLIERLNHLTEEILTGKRAKLPKAISIDWSDELFWSTIEEARKSSNSLPEYYLNLENLLSLYSGANILKFKELYTSKLPGIYNHDNWAVAYLAKGGCSDDGFSNFILWVVSQGEKTYQAALDSPYLFAATMEPCWSCSCEEVLSIIDRAYEMRMGKEIPEIAVELRIKGKNWKESELETRYPDVVKLFSH